ncbi:MAG: DUF427 domain-containing protein [Pseudomonadota bacterium]
MKASWNGAVLAESDDTVVVEGNHYFPEASLNHDLFVASDHSSHCPWKGTAGYYHVEVQGARNDNAAWFYAEPYEAAQEIKGRVAFWKGIEVTDS